MFEEERVKKPVLSIISFVTGLLSCACAPMGMLAGFMWLVSGFNLASNASTNTDFFFALMTYSPFVGIIASIFAIAAFVIGMVRHEDMKWLRIIGFLMGLATVPIHLIGMMMFFNSILVAPVV